MNCEGIYAGKFFDLPMSELFDNIFKRGESPVNWLNKIREAVNFLANSNDLLSRDKFPPGCHIGDDVFIHESAELPAICVVDGPCYVGANTKIRPFAYIRENVIIGEKCVLGNSTEIKNSILLTGVQAPHFNYIGDSILGNYSHLGAGVILANLKLNQTSVKISTGLEKFDTGRRKFGAIVGDHAEVGCNSVLNPGCVLSKNCKIASNVSLRGFVEENALILDVAEQKIVENFD